MVHLPNILASGKTYELWDVFFQKTASLKDNQLVLVKQVLYFGGSCRNCC
jgi:hypothetical protein